MIDYGAVVIKNGEVINKNIFFMNMLSAGWIIAGYGTRIVMSSPIRIHYSLSPTVLTAIGRSFAST